MNTCVYMFVCIYIFIFTRGQSSIVSLIERYNKWIDVGDSLRLNLRMHGCMYINWTWRNTKQYPDSPINLLRISPGENLVRSWGGSATLHIVRSCNVLWICICTFLHACTQMRTLSLSLSLPLSPPLYPFPSGCIHTDRKWLAVAGNPHVRLYRNDAQTPGHSIQLEGHTGAMTAVCIRATRMKWVKSPVCMSLKQGKKESRNTVVTTTPITTPRH